MTGAELWPYLAMVLVGYLPNEVWRWLGIVMARGLDERSEIVVWVRAVATAILAGVIAKLTFIPPGALASVPLSVRLASVVVGFACFLVSRRSLWTGVLAGELVLIVGSWALGR
jgi:hypothetical protein